MLTPEEVGTKKSVLSAQDVQVLVVSQPIPGTSAVRPLRRVWSSVSVGFKYSEAYDYTHSASESGWCAVSGTRESVEAI